jgi:type I restriction enzyme S subunit
LDKLKKEFPDDMKNSILQAAMQGRLTKQLESDSDVYKWHQESLEIRKQSIKNKVTKNEKIESSYETVPFDIPENWIWTKLGNIANLKMGKTPPRAETQFWGEDYPWISISDMMENGHVNTVKEYISEAGLNKYFKQNMSPAGTLIMSFKLTVGRVSIINIPAVHNEAIISIFPYNDMNNILRDYLFLILPFMSNYGDTKQAIKGKTLNSKSLNNLFIPLPPLEEQQRIVDKLNKLIPLCDKLQEYQ